MSSQNSIKVGIDFGTVTTEVAYICSSRFPDSLKSIQQWPGTFSGNRIVPSVVSFSADNRAISWGHRADKQPQTYAWSKLLLDSNTRSGDFADPVLCTISNSSILRRPRGRQPEEVVSDFLRQIRFHILNHLATFENVQNSRQIEFIFATPISWSVGARRSMERAIHRAEFGTCGDKWRTISEPEAAATAIFRQMPGAFRPGDGVIICDIGGGTVDVTACQITEVQSLVLFEELATAVGGKCGSAAIDSRFYQLLSERLGIRVHELPQIYSGKGKALLSHLERIKISFTGNEQTVESIPVRLNPKRRDHSLYDSRTQFITPKPHHIKEVFDPVIDQIYKLILHQIGAANQKFGRCMISKVVVTGGLGTSPYVRRKLELFLNEAQGLGIGPLITPDEPPQRRDCCARSSSTRPDRSGNSNSQELASLWDRSMPRPCCPFPVRGQMNTGFSGELPCKWFLAKNVRYASGHRRPLTVSMLHCPGQSSIKEMMIWVCDLDGAPSHVDERQMARKARVICDVSSLREQDCMYGEFNGQWVWIFEVKVEIHFDHTSGNVTVAAFVSGNPVGQSVFRLDDY